MERVEQLVRTAYDDDGDSIERQRACDYFWYLWCGCDSPLFDKSKMSTFERYFIDDKSTHKEAKVGTIAYALMPTFVTTSWMLLE